MGQDSQQQPLLRPESTLFPLHQQQQQQRSRVHYADDKSISSSSSSLRGSLPDGPARQEHYLKGPFRWLPQPSRPPPVSRGRPSLLNRFLDWYEIEMANLAFISIVVQMLAAVGFGLFFFFESTTITYNGRTGVMLAAIFYTFLFFYVMCIHFPAEFIYTWRRGRSTYNSASAQNCRRVWNIRICVALIVTATFINLWVLYGTDQGMDMLKVYSEHNVEHHQVDGHPGDLMLLYAPQRLSYAPCMRILGVTQFILFLVIFGNALGYAMPDETAWTYRFLRFHWAAWYKVYGRPGQDDEGAFDTFKQN